MSVRGKEHLAPRLQMGAATKLSPVRSRILRPEVLQRDKFRNQSEYVHMKDFSFFFQCFSSDEGQASTVDATATCQPMIGALQSARGAQLFTGRITFAVRIYSWM